MEENLRDLTANELKIWFYHSDLKNAYPGLDKGNPVSHAGFIKWLNEHYPHEKNIRDSVLELTDPDFLGDAVQVAEPEAEPEPKPVFSTAPVPPPQPPTPLKEPEPDIPTEDELAAMDFHPLRRLAKKEGFKTKKGMDKLTIAKKLHKFLKANAEKKN